MFGPGIPPQVQGRAFGGNPILSVEKLHPHRNHHLLGQVQIKLNHRFQGDQIHQQPVGVLNLHLGPELRHHIAAKGSQILLGKKEALPAQQLQDRPDSGKIRPAHLPEGFFAEGVGVVHPLKKPQLRPGCELGAALFLLYFQLNGRDALPQLVAAHHPIRLAKGHKLVKEISGQGHGSGLAGGGFQIAAQPPAGLVQIPLKGQRAAEQGQQRPGLVVEGLGPVEERKLLPIRDGLPFFDSFQQGRDALDDVLPPAPRDPQPNLRQAVPGQGQLRFQGNGSFILRLQDRLFQQDGVLVHIFFQQKPGRVVRLGLHIPPFPPEQHFQAGSIAVLPGRMLGGVFAPPHHPGNGGGRRGRFFG